MKRRYRKEPKNIADFKRRFSVTKKLPPTEAKKVMINAHKLVDGTNGRGYNLFFPLAETASTGDFLKGVMKIIAPQTKITFLKAPLADNIKSKESQAILLSNVKKAISPTDKKIKLVDYFFIGRSYDGISHALKTAGFKGELDNVSMENFYPLIESFLKLPRNQGFVKSNDGQALLQFRDYVKYSTKHPRAVSRMPDKYTPAQVRMNRRKAYQFGIAFAKEYMQK